MLGDGFNPRQLEFFQLTENQKFNDGWVLDSFGGVGFQMSLNTQLHNRSVYSILDFLGDVGGLLSILLSIGALFVSLIHVFSKSFLERHVVNKVFKNLKATLLK